VFFFLFIYKKLPTERSIFCSLLRGSEDTSAVPLEPRMARETWTDERLDDLRTHMDKRFDQVDQRFDSVQQTMIIGFVTLFASIVASVIAGILATQL
ncbi:MAG: hypothetical protein ACTHN7_04700, partial [Solirubrobacterales bacterium]